MTVISDRSFHTTIPALAAYIGRIGAEELNPRRYMKKEHQGHYYHERYLITLAEDGAISVIPEHPDYMPTEGERAAILMAFAAGVPWPKPIPANDPSADALGAELRDPNLFRFYNQNTGQIIMVQQRIDAPQGKRYIPWTFCNDGFWYRMEPDGDLPFWKPPQATDKRKIMTHEGAKAAKAAQAIADDPDSTHPWAPALREYEHWGIIGGALSPHRAAYQELWDRGPEELVYICDNDAPGKAAVVTVSRKYGRTMKFADFDDSFPPAWDMADPLPSGAKPLREYMGSCT
jgi:hypothetical protein